LVADYALSGLGESLSESNRFLKSGDFTEWDLGVTYRGQLGNRARRAEARRADLELARQRAILAQLEQDIVDELTRSYQDLVAAYETVRLNQSLRQAAATQLEARQALYDHGGQISVDLLLRTQSTHADAVSDFWRAVARYNQFLAAWNRAVGAARLAKVPPETQANGVPHSSEESETRPRPLPQDPSEPQIPPPDAARSAPGAAKISRLPPPGPSCRVNR
jgi:outer membrane protein TolC